MRIWKKVLMLMMCFVAFSLAACGGTGVKISEKQAADDVTVAAKSDDEQTAADTEATPIDVYVLAGQSNMAGTSRVDLLPEKYRRTYPRVKMYYEVGAGMESDMRQWTVVQPGQGAYINNTPYFGPELGMAEVLQNRDSEIAFVKYAYGGTAIYQNPNVNDNASNRDNWHGSWDGATPGRLYNGLFSTVDTAMRGLREQGYAPVIRGMAWMQGETDGEIQFNGGNGNHAAADAYEHNLTEFFKAVRAELQTPELPIVIGEIYEYNFSVVEARKIVQAQARVAEQANTYLVNTGDLAINGAVDTWHWNGLSEWLLGVRFGETLYRAVHGVSVAQA